jgi:hypothetical protein
MAERAAPLHHEPPPALFSCDSQAIRYFARRDLLGQDPGPIEAIWALPAAQRIFSRQQADGSWRYPGRNRGIYTEINYDLLETFRQLGILAGEYGLDRRHPAVDKAADYLFACQTEEGDIRGILGTQYMPYYHGAILELLIKVGYEDDARVKQGLAWLLSMRQQDGGWIVPVQAVPARQKTREMWSAAPIPPGRSRPFSHLATGMALRPLAVHPTYRQLEVVTHAAHLLKSRFFQADKYNDRKAPGYWTKFQYPFWWTNLLTSLDTLSQLGLEPGDADVQRALQWFVDNQQADGTWRTFYEQPTRAEPSDKERDATLWVSLAVCRVFRRFGLWQAQQQDRHAGS